MGSSSQLGLIIAPVRWHYRNNFSIFFNMKACCVFQLESPHRGDSNEYTQHAIINIKKKIILNYPKYNNVCSYGILSLGTQGRVRNSCGKRAIGVRAIVVLLYLCLTQFIPPSLQIANFTMKYFILSKIYTA